MRPFGNDHFSTRIFRTWLLQYSRAEKRGIALFLLFIILVWILPNLWNQFKPVPETALILQTDGHAAGHSTLVKSQSETENAGIEEKARWHAFDPNTAGADELLNLGFNRQTVRRMLRYREKGGVFRKKEDLFRIWGIDTNLVRTLLPYVQEQKTRGEYVSPEHVPITNPPYRSKPEPFKVDVNTADSFMLQRLPGIGPKLAARIVAYREKLGGFYSLNQLNEVYGLNPESLTRLNKEQLWHIGHGVYRKIAVNRAEAPNLRHPYINRKQASIIQAYRNQHGLFEDSAAMHGVLAFSAEELHRLFPYLDYRR